METDNCFQDFRNAIHSISPLSEKSLSVFLGIFSQSTIRKDEFFVKSGDYSKYFAFICRGIIRSYYDKNYKNEETNNLFIDHMFVLPLPSFIYRGPSYLNYQALTDISYFTAKYSDLEDLSLHQPVIYKFIRILIDREWIINRELHESGLHIYNEHTRFRIFSEKFSSYLSVIDPSIISSYLQVPLKQVEKFIKEKLQFERI
jgi:hypothetical protein